MSLRGGSERGSPLPWHLAHFGLRRGCQSRAGWEDTRELDVACREGQEGDVARSLEGEGEHALMPGTGTRLAPGLDLGAVGDEATKLGGLLVVDGVDFIDAERADAAPAETAPTPTGTPPGTRIAVATATTAAVIAATTPATVAAAAVVAAASATITGPGRATAFRGRGRRSGRWRRGFFAGCCGFAQSSVLRLGMTRTAMSEARLICPGFTECVAGTLRLSIREGENSAV
jgi:hypothetical protein